MKFSRLDALLALLLGAGLSLGALGASVTVDPESVGMGTVAWSEKALKDGTVRLTLKATAADGCAFAGWSVAENDVIAWPDDLRYPGSLTATVVSNAVVSASFSICADDGLSFDVSSVLPEEIACGESFLEGLDINSVSFPTVTFKNLPPGLSFDERTLTVFGVPTEPGLYQVEADAVNGSGFTYRSFCIMRVENISGSRVVGDDTEVPLDEYFYSEIGKGDASDIFSFSEMPTSVSLSGSVPGLVWRGDWQLLYGTPTEAGVYTLKATVHFPTGGVETATVTLTVAGEDPDDYNLDLCVLDGLQVGNEFDDAAELGADSSDTAIRGVTGLPTGLKVSARYENGARRWFVSGMAREPGFFSVMVQVDDRRGETQRVVRVVRTVKVDDLPDVYLTAVSADSSLGTVSGGGAVSPIEDVTLVASPRSGSVFTGWYDSEGEQLPLREEVDYRTPRITLPAETDYAVLAAIAHFAPEADDEAPDLSEFDGTDVLIEPDESSETTFLVESLSLPTLTFKGLPRGVTCAANGIGGFNLSYDSASSAASGRYAVTVTAVNASGRKSSTTFRITVETRSDSRIRVYDDYGELTPGEAIDPIDLSVAVSFDNGETLSVSGLPKGLAYNAKANAKKGIAAHSITGTPTVPGDYTLTFTAKVVSSVTTNKSGRVAYKYETAKATSFLTVLPYPELAIGVDEDAAAAGCKVSGAGNYKPGTKVTLKATAAKGWVFSGWEGLDDVGALESLNPKLSCVTGEDDLWVQAWFVPISEDGLSVGEPDLTDAGFAAEWPLGVELGEDEAPFISDLIETVSLPTVKVSGLPSGVKFSPTTLLLSGKPTKSGVYHVTVTAKNAGGYSFVRVFDLAVLNRDGTRPTEKALENAAELDFAPLKGLMTGVQCPTGSVVLTVGPRPETGSAVEKVTVSGLPAGLTASVDLAEDGAKVEVTGTPTKPGRFVVTITVSYAKGKSLKSQVAVVVGDGGSRYLFVTVADGEGGTVSGEGVYASGETVKLVAKAAKEKVFAGWCVADETGDLSLFGPLRDIDGIDPRTPSVAFPFRPTDFAGTCELTGVFADAADDEASVIETTGGTWEICLTDPSAFVFSIDSLSVPKVTVTGLPKGVTVDAARGILSYEPNAAVVPGEYTVKISAKNATQSKATVKTVTLRVPALPSTLGGTFTGVLADEGGAVVGTISITATSAGRVTVSAKTAAKSASFTSKIWDSFADDVASVVMAAKDGMTCDLSIAATDDWRSWQAKGCVSLGDGCLEFEAQRNPYGKKDGFAEARAVVAEMAGQSTVEGWSVRIKSDGTVTIAGRYEGTSLSGSTILQWNENAAFARYVKFANKKTVIPLVFAFDEDGRVIEVRLMHIDL